MRTVALVRDEISSCIGCGIGFSVDSGHTCGKPTMYR
jgi:hypothetical protein